MAVLQYKLTDNDVLRQDAVAIYNASANGFHVKEPHPLIGVVLAPDRTIIATLHQWDGLTPNGKKAVFLPNGKRGGKPQDFFDMKILEAPVTIEAFLAERDQVIDAAMTEVKGRLRLIEKRPDLMSAITNSNGAVRR